MKKIKDKSENVAEYEVNGKSVQVFKRPDQTFEEVIAEASVKDNTPSNEKGIPQRIRDIEARLDAAGL